MTKKNIMLDFSLLKTNKNFRAVFIARLMSILGIGMMDVAVPVQIFNITGSSLQVGVAVALHGIGLFIGLMFGGVLADRFDRKWLIIGARAICGIGFLLLMLNAYLEEPTLWAIYTLSLWDGFFSAIGMTALLACLPNLVGRENVPTAGALSMLVVRIGSVVSPALAGLIIVSFGLVWNYTLAAVGTFFTLIALLWLPSMKPQSGGSPEKPLQSLFNGFSFVFKHKVIRVAVVLGTLDSMAPAIRIVFPALAAITSGGDPLAVGFMFAAVPAGSVLGALTSGWIKALTRPGMVMVMTASGSFLIIALLGLMNHLVLVLLVLVVLGYLRSIGGILQYSIVQGHTPDHMLGRIGSFWTAQAAVGNSAGSIGVGVISKLLTPTMSLISLGLGCSALIFLFAGVKSLRSASLMDASLVPEQKS